MIEINNKINAPIEEKKLEDITQAFLEEYNKNTNQNISLAIVKDNEIRELNKTYRGKNRITDVLSFSDKDKGFLGEIIICWEQIRIQSKAAGKTEWQEFVFIFLHGMLHLLGYTDDKEEDRQYMVELAKNFINSHKHLL